MRGTQARLTPGNGTATTQGVLDEAQNLAQWQMTCQAVDQRRHLITHELSGPTSE
jgi:hypothetical protein